jgi:hypothetical protein
MRRVIHQLRKRLEAVADLTRKRSRRRTLRKALCKAYVTGNADCGAEIAKLLAVDIAVIFIAHRNRAYGQAAGDRASIERSAEDRSDLSN